MALIEMRAEFRCDGCGRLFSVRVDHPTGYPAGWTHFEVAEDAVRSGVARNLDGTFGCSSVQDGRHLCGPCTSAADANRCES